MVVAVMAFAGFTAGLLGIGGALIFNPVLLQLGVQPQVSLSGSLSDNFYCLTAQFHEQIACCAMQSARSLSFQETHLTAWVYFCRSPPLPVC